MSCEDYYTRDGITPGAAVTVAIDIDGLSTTNSPIAVMCLGQTVGSQSQICTDVRFMQSTFDELLNRKKWNVWFYFKVAPNGGQNLKLPSNCFTNPSTPTLPNVFGDTEFNYPSVIPCNDAAVNYGVQEPELSALIAASQNCVQTVGNCSEDMLKSELSS